MGKGKRKAVAPNIQRCCKCMNVREISTYITGSGGRRLPLCAECNDLHEQQQNQPIDLVTPIQSGNVIMWEQNLFLFRCEVHETEHNIHHILTVKTGQKKQWIYTEGLFSYEAVEDVIREWLRLNRTAGTVETLPQIQRDAPEVATASPNTVTRNRRS